VGERTGLQIAVVSSKLPRRCGIATFSADMVAAVMAADPRVRTNFAAIDEPGVVRLYGDDVRWRIRQGDAHSYRAAARAINASPVNVVNVQHEFGLYGYWVDATYQDHLRPFLETLHKPVVTTLHTVPTEPSTSISDAVRSAAKVSDELVVMAKTAVDLLASSYGIKENVTLIPHGMPAVEPNGRNEAKAKLGLRGRTLISTFGLVDPRKGLEYMIEAMPAVLRRHPTTVYLIAGQTHPELVRREGERYRSQLVDLVQRLKLQSHVQFVDEYMDLPEIIDVLHATDVYVTPYLDPQQVTSGTLVYAMGAGKAIVSTRYLHAREALADGRGVLVGFRESRQVARAVNSVLDQPSLKLALERRAYAYAKDMAWPRAGERWLTLMREVLARHAAVRHIAGGGGRRLRA
jgi:glycosyltransferase involved in cell wall biosynthesis